MRARWLAAAVAALPALALGQSPPNLLPQRMYVEPGALLGSTRMVALGGAYVAVAEGADGMSANLAAITQHPPDLQRPWDVDGILSWNNIGFGRPGQVDPDNSGTASGAHNTTQLLGAARVQFVHHFVRVSLQLLGAVFGEFRNGGLRRIPVARSILI